MTGRTDRPLTGPFWAATDNRQLVRPVCQDCGRSHFSPQVVCPWCRSSAWSYVPSSGNGTIYSHTTIHRPPDPAFEAPYVVADIEMEEDWRMFGWIVNCDPNDVRMHMPVKVTFVEGPEGDLLPAFEPS